MENNITDFYEVPQIWDAALSFLDSELRRVLWNITQKEVQSPFANTGQKFKCEAFEVEAYSWDEEYNQPFNFKWRDVEISWYKYLGRGMSANKELTADLAAEMLEESIDCLQKYETENEE